VKMPRFRIAWGMVAVAIAALEFAAIRASYDIPEVFFSLLGALPMANVLAVGILVAQQHPGSRPFLLGFETFGAMALALFVAVAVASFSLDTDWSIPSYLAMAIQPIEKRIGQDRPFVLTLIVLFAHVVMLGGPQLVLALIGGFLSWRFKIAITRRC
jgi:hypothetical protein